MIAAVSTVRNEVDIIESSIKHLLNEGVELVLVADGRSTDGTRDLLQDLKETMGGRVNWYDDGGEWRQQTWVDKLALIASDEGADWILPVDADEYWRCPDGRPLSDALADVPEHVTVLQAMLFHHSSWEMKVVPAEGLPKVAYRPAPDAWIGPGNHTVSRAGEHLGGLIEIRHFQYRSYEHFCRKVAERIETLPPDIRARGDGGHIMRLDGVSENEMRAAWAELEAREQVYDPIPSRC